MRNNYWLLVPVFGICIFIILYFASSSLYPGGSEVDKSAKGFSWLHNYWCELMDADAQNGQNNTARPLAITAMFVLAVSLVIFWITIPGFFRFRPMVQRIIQYSGVFSMAIILLLFTGNHDAVINIAGLFGFIAITGVSIGLYRKRLLLLFGIGILCLVLFCINNYIYYTTRLLYYLPLIQKITFLFFLLWFCLVSIHVFKKKKKLIG